MADRFSGERKASAEGEVFWYPLARLHLSDKLIDGFGEVLRVFPSDEISEVYYAGGVDAWDTVFC